MNTKPQPKTARRTKPRLHGVFCLEGDWWGIKDKTTVEPVFELLSRSADARLDYIHRNVGTVEELEYNLRKWRQKGLKRYPILYLAFHGSSGEIYVGDQRKTTGTISLDRLEELLGGACKGKLIHFGSCKTLDPHGHRWNSFMKRTGALAVSGYRNDTDWIASAAFEILLFAQLQHNAMTRAGLRAAATSVKSEAPGLTRDLGFRMHVSKTT